MVDLQFVSPEESRSLNSTLRPESRLKGSRKAGNSVVNRLAVSRSGAKERTGTKAGSQVGSGMKGHERGMFNSPFTPVEPTGSN